jgi:tetratricopeptide (TPR) repeat protein
VKKGGTESTDLLVLEGRCWLRLEVEADAVEAFASAVRIDSTLKPEIAGLMRDEALANMRSGSTARGRRYLLKAYDYDSLLDFGAYNAVAGELLLGRKEFGGAARHLERYLRDHPDTTGAAGVMLNLGEAYEGQGKREEAIDLYRLFNERYPKSRLGTTVDWKLEKLLFVEGEELYAGGDLAEAELAFTELTRTAGNKTVLERAYFILGEISEKQGNVGQAIRYYTEVIHLNLHSSGRLVAQAKERIEKLEQSRDRR